MDGSPPRCYPFWYLNHGSDTLARSEHDNSQVVLWTLREKGVCLKGPDIVHLIDPISADDLRIGVREMDIAIASGLLMPTFAYQAFWVGLICRILHTLETGLITSKKQAMGWAQSNLDPSWQGLITRSLSLRKGDGKQASAPTVPEEVTSTRSFATYCLNKADAMLKDNGIGLDFDEPNLRP